MIYAIITNISILFSFNFFVYALVSGVALAIVFALLGNFVVMRKEANISHTISHFALFGVTIALLVDVPLYPSIIIGALLWAVLVSLLKKTNRFWNDSINEILSQWWLVAALIVLGFVVGYKANIMDYLFGDILTVTFYDMISAIILCAVVIIFFVLFHKKLFQVSFHRELAISKWVNIWLINSLYLLFLSLAIATSIKIIGVLLITAFLIVPINISKLLAKNYMSSLYIAISICVLSVLTGLILSYFLNLASGPVIVGVLLTVLFVVTVFKMANKKSGRL